MLSIPHCPPPAPIRPLRCDSDVEWAKAWSRGPCSMAALISRFVNVPIAGAHRAWRPTQSPPRPHPSRPASILEEPGKARPLFFFLNTCHLSVENLSLTPSASCIPLSYSLPIVQFVTVCFTPDHLLSHSHSPTSIKSLSPIAVSLSRWLPSSLW